MLLHVHLVLCKGRLVSKGRFGFFNSPKETKISCQSRLRQKLEFLSSFLVELETPKRNFEIN
jgi:hypothetical protein